jgi:hypothetical protein
MLLYSTDIDKHRWNKNYRFNFSYDYMFVNHESGPAPKQSVNMSVRIPINTNKVLVCQ